MKILSNKEPVKKKREYVMPTETNEKYECDICGAIVEVKEGGTGNLECYGQPMTLKE